MLVLALWLVLCIALILRSAARPAGVCPPFLSREFALPGGLIVDWAVCRHDACYTPAAAAALWHLGAFAVDPAAGRLVRALVLSHLLTPLRPVLRVRCGVLRSGRGGAPELMNRLSRTLGRAEGVPRPAVERVILVSGSTVRSFTFECAWRSARLGGALELGAADVVEATAALGAAPTVFTTTPWAPEGEKTALGAAL